ncbi:hypothetical protein C2W64_04078 [Brevibacillus laterosporus]|nr:YopX family protein [Brevibacillus laterosporus]RAP29131.1 hypothetical protein C2W64_04078 [Brevibacillus laterosporus]
MREIKFRAWDDVSKVMSFSNFEQFDDMMGFRFSHFETVKPIYMQCTGIRDKNGKEIYEGDFVRVLIQGGYSQHFIDQEVVTSVMYIPSKAHYKPFDQCRIWMEDGKLPKVEVIGNIYEHPHLLNQE